MCLFGPLMKSLVFEGVVVPIEKNEKIDKKTDVTLPQLKSSKSSDKIQALNTNVKEITFLLISVFKH